MRRKYLCRGTFLRIMATSALGSPLPKSVTLSSCQRAGADVLKWRPLWPKPQLAQSWLCDDHRARIASTRKKTSEDHSRQGLMEPREIHATSIRLWPCVCAQAPPAWSLTRTATCFTMGGPGQRLRLPNWNHGYDSIQRQRRERAQRRGKDARLSRAAAPDESAASATSPTRQSGSGNLTAGGQFLCKLVSQPSKGKQRRPKICRLPARRLSQEDDDEVYVADGYGNHRPCDVCRCGIPDSTSHGDAYGN